MNSTKRSSKIKHIAKENPGIALVMMTATMTAMMMIIDL